MSFSKSIAKSSNWKPPSPSNIKELRQALARQQLEEQAAQIQKVSAQLAAASPSHGGLEASKPAPQVVNNP